MKMRGSILLCLCVCVPLSMAVPRQGFKTRAAQSGGFFGEIENLRNNFFSFIKKGFGGRPPQNIPPPLQPPPHLAIRPNHGGKLPPPRPVQPPKNPLPLPPNFPNSFTSFNPNPPASSFVSHQHQQQHQQGGGFLNAAPPSESNFGFQGPPIGSFPKPEFSFGEIPAPALGPTPAPAPLPVPVHVPASKPHFTEENYHIPASVQQFGAPAFFDSSKKPQESGGGVQPFVDLTGELELGAGGIHDHKHTISDSNKEVILNNLVDQDLLDRVKHNLWREDLKNTQLAHNKKTHLNKSSNRRLLIDRPAPVIEEASSAVTLESKTLPVVEAEITPEQASQQTTSEVNFGFMDPSFFQGF